MSLFRLRRLARQGLAAVAMFGFSLNVATPTIAHGCSHVTSAGTAVQDEASPAHHGHHSEPAPAGKSTHGTKCECVGHSCGTALAVPAQAASGPRTVAVVTTTESVPDTDRRPAIVRYLLPYAVGPPSSSLA